MNEALFNSSIFTSSSFSKNITTTTQKILRQKIIFLCSLSHCTTNFLLGEWMFEWYKGAKFYVLIYTPTHSSSRSLSFVSLSLSIRSALDARVVLAFSRSLDKSSLFFLRQRERERKLTRRRRRRKKNWWAYAWSERRTWTSLKLFLLLLFRCCCLISLSLPFSLTYSFFTLFDLLDFWLMRWAV